MAGARLSRWLQPIRPRSRSTQSYCSKAETDPTIPASRSESGDSLQVDGRPGIARPPKKVSNLAERESCFGAQIFHTESQFLKPLDRTAEENRDLKRAELVIAWLRPSPTTG